MRDKELLEFAKPNTHILVFQIDNNPSIFPFTHFIFKTSYKKNIVISTPNHSFVEFEDIQCDHSFPY